MNKYVIELIWSGHIFPFKYETMYSRAKIVVSFFLKKKQQTSEKQCLFVLK